MSLAPAQINAENDCDLVIVGAGLAGATLALQTRQLDSSASILVIDSKSRPQPEGMGSVGESTVELASYYLCEMLGLREHLRSAQLPKLGLRYFLDSRDKSAIENRLEVGAVQFPSTPSFQLDRARLENHLLQELQDRGIALQNEASVTGCKLSAAGHTVKFRSRNSAETCIRTKWLVDATGRRSFLKRRLGLQGNKTHAGSAVWWRLKGNFQIDDWCAEPAWQQRNGGAGNRWLSTNHLMGQGYWVWIIPLASGYTSFGIVADGRQHSFSRLHTFEKALSWMREHEPQLAGICEAHREEVLDFGLMKDYFCAAEKVFSAERWALCGDAGCFIDPFYSPGADFIALSNTFVSDLIARDLCGEKIRSRVEIYNDIFLNFAEATVSVYRDQYGIFGNPLVMPLKVFWDWSFYWHFLARLFVGGKMCDLAFFSDHRSELVELRSLSDRMQQLFRRWNRVERPSSSPGFLNLDSHSYLSNLNASLLADRSQTTELFLAGVKELRAIACEMKDLFEERTGESFDLGLAADREKAPAGIVASYYEDLGSFFHAV